MRFVGFEWVLSTLFIVVAAGLAQAESPIVVIKTSMGTIKIELNEAKAPITVKNFLAYVDEGFYDGTIFHRVIEGIDVVDKIKKVATTTHQGMADMPAQPVMMESVRRAPK